MTTRILTPTRDREGWLHHRCPLNDSEIDPSSCQICPHFDHLEELSSKYRMYCNAPSSGPELIEIKPAKAYDTHQGLKGVELLSSSEHTWLEPKLDGARAIVHCTEDGVFITSRRRDRTGKYNQFQDNIPHIRDHAGLNAIGKIGYTILDAEIIMPVDTDILATTMGVVGSHPAKAIALQEKKGLAVLHVFDCPRVWGTDMISDSLHQRREALAHINRLGHFDGDTIELVEVLLTEDIEEKKRYLENCLAIGLEGVIAKNPQAGYSDSHAWLKLKQKTTVDAIVTGWEYGSAGGKLEFSIGALKVSVQNQNGKLQEIAKVGSGDDETREALFLKIHQMTDSQILDLAIVIEMEAQGWTKDFRLRHPRILRYRQDRSEPNEINFSTLTTL
jgi:ATP-dependent DNA ligase